MTKDEALRLALEALEKISMGGDPRWADKAITAIKAALEAKDEPWEKFCDSNCVWTDHHPECKLAKDEPVAWMAEREGKYRAVDETDWGSFAVYTTPQQRKPLTDEEIGAILEGVNAYGTRLYTFARAIEAAHGIKGEDMSIEAMKQALEKYLCREMPAGTVIGDPKWWANKIANELAKQEQGEPVASMVVMMGEVTEMHPLREMPDGTHQLYTTPPQRKPLTNEEICDAVRESDIDWHQGWTLDDDEPNRFMSLARAIEAAHGIKGEA
jgi:hypothetical protein